MCILLITNQQKTDDNVNDINIVVLTALFGNFILYYLFTVSSLLSC